MSNGPASLPASTVGPSKPAVPSPPSAQAPVGAIVGPTAAGKSALALALAQKLGGEVVSADAVQVYLGCDIGSAKPTLAQRAQVPHHLIDVAQPTERFDASLFTAQASAAIAAIRERGHTPILCGGTGLYLRALRLGLIDVPKNPTLRAELEAEDARSPGASMARLVLLDAPSARAIHPNNASYVRRALEITLVMGRPASLVWAEHRQQGERQPVTLYWLDEADDLLRARITERAHQMLADGLIDEVQRLLDGGVPAQSPALKAVGYAEGAAFLGGDLPRSQLAQAIITNTWGYVRRQRIWLRREHKEGPHRVVRLPEGQSLEAQVAHLARLWPRG